ncbi:MAG: hypothetical protein LBU65_03370 [Planctomycetaceae bacterium]|jgi:hypothetical protein|nr:hypothetical protein [Planctomycetaceae bacterium]
MTTQVRFVLLLCLSLPFVGCTQNNQVTVSGTVKVDNSPVPGGFISFTAPDGSTATDGAEIVNGHYKIKTVRGEKKVKIRGTKNVPTTVYDAVSKKTYTGEEPVLITPPVYETDNSPLKVTIEKNGEVHDFDIPSK